MTGLSPESILLSIVTFFSGAVFAMAWRVYDKVDKIERQIAAVIQKIGGIE